jgi:hypothetical protein
MASGHVPTLAIRFRGNPANSDGDIVRVEVAKSVGSPGLRCRSICRYHRIFAELGGNIGERAKPCHSDVAGASGGGVGLVLAGGQEENAGYRRLRK